MLIGVLLKAFGSVRRDGDADLGSRLHARTSYMICVYKIYSFKEKTGAKSYIICVYKLYSFKERTGVKSYIICVYKLYSITVLFVPWRFVY